MIRVSTAIEGAIISRNSRAFVTGLSTFVLGFVPIALVNNLLKYGLAEMVLRFRKRLTTYLLAQYMQGSTYYQISNTDNRIANPDQLLTQDVDRFASSIVELYSNLSKPLLDIGVYAFKLAHTIGLQGPGTMLGYLAVAGVVLTWLRRPIGRFTVCEQQIEGEYRYVNSRLITHR
jgi:ATP-binding cassette subfamily D (ALD) protein 3